MRVWAWLLGGFAALLCTESSGPPRLVGPHWPGRISRRIRFLEGVASILSAGNQHSVLLGYRQYFLQHRVQMARMSRKK